MTIFLSIGTLFLSMAVVVIAWQQWRVAKNKLRLDLFERRRYKVYDAARNFLIRIAQYNDFDESELVNFAAGISDAEFLFGANVLDYLKQIRKRALDMQDHQAILEENKLQGDELSRRGHAELERRSWLKKQITDMASVFAPYLGFTNIKYEGEMREMNKGVNRLAILLGGLGTSFVFIVAIVAVANSKVDFKWWGGWLGLIIALIVAFFIPFGLVHAIAWVVRGFKQGTLR